MELLHSESSRAGRLAEYLALLASGSATKQSHDGYADLLSTATAFEVNSAIDAVLSRTNDIESLKGPVSRFIRAAGKGLDRESLPAYPAGHLLAPIDAENGAIAARLEKLQALVKAVQGGSCALSSVTDAVRAMTVLGDHYVTLQNGLFPLFEKAAPEHGCVKLMWAIQNDVLGMQKKLCGMSGTDPDFWKLFGSFFLTAGSLVYREKRILYPVAFRSIPADGTGVYSAAENDTRTSAFSSITGSLGPAELEAIFKVIPVDIAFIGADDRVKFYSDPPHRIFPRSPAVIGRLVQNCHPPKSVATVTAILTSFRDGSSSSAEFWLTVKDRFIHIEYFALRSPDGTYLGTLEVSQDATQIRALVGEKRLL